MVSSCKFEQIMIQIFKNCHKYHLCPTIVHQSKTTLVFALLASCRTLGLRVSFCIQPLAVSCLPDNGQKQVGGSEDIGSVQYAVSQICSCTIFCSKYRFCLDLQE